jgi:two-component system, sporulation sensor kinase E
MTVKELQHLAAAMAHEVRNPLNSMAIHVELMEGRLKKEGAAAEVMKSLTVLSSEIERIDKILEQYLGYAGPSEAARAPVAPKVLLAGVVEQVKAAAQKRGVTVELKGDGAGGGAKWTVDAEALAEALAAVVANAVAATAKGGTVVVSARTDDDNDQAEVAITDAAEPIADAEVAKVFHIGSKRSRGEVGLSVAKQIVKGHGGSITVKGGEKGNTFTIRLPLEAEG